MSTRTLIIADLRDAGEEDIPCGGVPVGSIGWVNVCSPRGSPVSLRVVVRVTIVAVRRGHSLALSDGMGEARRRSLNGGSEERCCDSDKSWREVHFPSIQEILGN
jgi:hypothetical protein